MLSAISTLSKAFFAICLLRKGPQDIPKSTVLFYCCLALYVLFNVFLSLQARSIESSLLVSLVDVAFLLTVTFLILRQHKFTDRWMQTVTAMTGTGVILLIFLSPLVFGSTQDVSEGIMQQVIVLLFMTMVFWNVAVLAHIMKHAISTTIGFGILIAVFYIFINSLLISVLFPEITVQ